LDSKTDERRSAKETKVVRAKFRCTESAKVTSAYGTAKPAETNRIKLQAVIGPGNEDWSKWTPSGELNIQISNPDAIDQFEVGKDYFIDFTEAL
jgi:hypothetical protein